LADPIARPLECNPEDRQLGLYKKCTEAGHENTPNAHALGGLPGAPRPPLFSSRVAVWASGTCYEIPIIQQVCRDVVARAAGCVTCSFGDLVVRVHN
jgi:hypothetical protein